MATANYLPEVLETTEAERLATGFIFTEGPLWHSASCHPLHVARTEPAAVAGRILVLHFSVEQIGHGLEPAMRMMGRAYSFARSALDRSHFVEQQERHGANQPKGRDAAR